MQLVNNPSRNSMVDQVMTDYDVYLLPVVNPDGYEYTDTVSLDCIYLIQLRFLYVFNTIKTFKIIQTTHTQLYVFLIPPYWCQHWTSTRIFAASWWRIIF